MASCISSFTYTQSMFGFNNASSGSRPSLRRSTASHIFYGNLAARALAQQQGLTMNTLYSDKLLDKSNGCVSSNSLVKKTSTAFFINNDEDSEEDVTTTIMKFNRKAKVKLSKSSKMDPALTTDGLESPTFKGEIDTKAQIIDLTSPKKSHDNNRVKAAEVIKYSDSSRKSAGQSASRWRTSPKLVQSKPHASSRKRRRSSYKEDSNRSSVSTATSFSKTDYEMCDSFEEYDGDEADLIKADIKQYSFFSSKDCKILEQMIDDEVVEKIDTFKSCTVDRAPLRNKYFFGEGYTYGTQMKRKGPGMEELYPKGYVDDIPEWIDQFVVLPLEKAGIIPKGYVNSCVINDYLPGGCIISHIDPKQLFDRPIYTISLLSDSALSFGVKFSFKPIRCSEPVYRIPLKRGCITSISGYAADNITHCVRPEDTMHRRAVIILRRVLDSAPRLLPEHVLSKQDSGRSSKMVDSSRRSSFRPSRNDDDEYHHRRKRSRHSAPSRHSYR